MAASCQGNSPKNIPTGAPEICNVPGLGKQAHLLSFTSSCIHKSGQNTSFRNLLRNGRTSAPGLRCWLFWTLPSSSVCGGLQRPAVYESLSGSCRGCFRRKQIIFSNLLPDAKLSAISTHSGHWSPLIGIVAKELLHVFWHLSVSSFNPHLHSFFGSSGGLSRWQRQGNTRGGIIILRHPKTQFFLQISGNSWLQWPNLLDHPWWWHCNLALSTADIIKCLGRLFYHFFMFAQLTLWIFTFIVKKARVQERVI